MKNTCIGHWVCALFSLFLLAGLLSACSSQQGILLYKKEKGSKIIPAILEIQEPQIRRIDKLLSESYQTVETYISYETPTKKNAWITSVDSIGIHKFIGQKNPRKVKKYRLLPGRHQIEFMYESTGTVFKRTIQDKPGFYLSVGFQSSYSHELIAPILIDIEASAGEMLSIAATVTEEICEIKVLRIKQDASSGMVVTRTDAIYSGSGRCRYVDLD